MTNPTGQVSLPTGRPGWVLNGLIVVSAGGAYILGALAGGADGARRFWLLITGAVCAAAVVAIQIAKQRRDALRIKAAERVAEEAKVALRTTLTGALAPITSHLGEVGGIDDPAGRARVAGKLSQAIVDAAVLLSSGAARSAFYRYEPDRRTLRREAYAGRAGVPREEFVDGTPDGDAVVDLVETDNLVFIDDVTANPMVEPTQPGAYNTVIAVAVTASARPLGMLTLDAPRTGDLMGADMEFLRVLANLLGAGLVMAE